MQRLFEDKQNDRQMVYFPLMRADIKEIKSGGYFDEDLQSSRLQ